MMTAILLLTPLITAAVSFLVRNDKFSKTLLAGTAAVHTVCTVHLWENPNVLKLGSSLVICADTDGYFVLAVTSILFLLCSIHLCFWFPVDSERSGGYLGMKQYTFISFLLIFLFTMSLAAVAQDFGMLWVAVEATTLASAPLINYHRSKGSLEAMWKYLLICSIGIGLALFGTMLLAAAQSDSHGSLGFAALNHALASGSIQLIWFKMGFVLCFAGYGLKMGIAPFHTWLPDAYSEAPSPVSALLSGCLINYALLAIVRLLDVIPPDFREFSDGYLKFFGFFSLAVAAFFIVRQKDFKRMLAYSSVEHMGLITLMLAYDLPHIAIFHMVFHSLIKMTLFLVAGNILLAYRNRAINGVHELFKRTPVNGTLWILGMLLICGTPPSPLFFTELQLVRSAGLIPGAAVLVLLLIIFAGMSHAVLKMCSPAGEVSGSFEVDKKVEKLAFIPAVSAVIITVSGVYALILAWILKGL